MSLTAKIREQLISNFRAELAEHVRTMTDGLLAVEQRSLVGEQRQTTLENIFRAAHSLKGAARAVGVTAIEQLAHALEDVLDAMQRDAISFTPALFTACYHALDAIQVVQAAYEAGETTPPLQALQALTELEPFRVRRGETGPRPAARPTAAAEARPGETPPVTPPPERESPETTPVAVPPAGPPTISDETIRINVSKLDTLMAQVSELLVAKIRADQRLVQIHQAQEMASSWQKEWLAIRAAYSRLAKKSSELSAELPPVEAESPTQSNAPKSDDDLVEMGKDLAKLLGYVSAGQERMRLLDLQLSSLTREYTSDTMNLALIIDSLEQEVKRARMLPLNTITTPFGRMIRDLAHAANKEAMLEIVGGNVELDRRVLEQIKDPLTHLLRNAIDHGIEPPAQRAALGKPRTGMVRLVAEQLGKEVLIAVTDDGRGLDIEAIRRAVARHSGIDTQEMTEGELAEAIFKLGVTTSPIITDVSGRGVGLDVVRRNVETLGGRISVDWTPNQGSTFTLTIPLTLTSAHALLVHVSDQVFAIPLSAIERILHIGREQVAPVGGHDAIEYNGRPLMLVKLSDVLGLPPATTPSSDDNEAFIVLILVAGERRLAFVIDDLVGEQEVVIKGLGKQLTRVGGIAGATILGGGEVVLILNASDLIKLALRSERRAILTAPAAEASAAATRRQQRILVVDDSITTRTLEKNILETAGYNVQIATDGVEALNVIAASGNPDLIIADLVMPRLNGFDLTQRLKSDPQTSHIPIILVTSLSSAEDKARGIEVGADAYIVKRSFDQNNLLETIEQLI